MTLIIKLKSKGFSGKFLMFIVALVNNVLQIPKIRHLKKLLTK